MRTSNIYRANNYSILIVDDEQLSRELLTRRLTHEGYAITTAENGQSAIALMTIERFDLVLLDINMLQYFEAVHAGHERLRSIGVVTSTKRQRHARYYVDD